MFYTYGLNADRAGSVTYFQVVAAASSQSAAATTRKGAQGALAGGISAQTGRILKGVGSGRSFSQSAASASLSKFRVRLSPPLTAASPETANSAQKHTAVVFSSAASNQAWNLTFPRLYHTIIATMSPNVARLPRHYAKLLSVITPSDPFDPAFGPEFGGGLAIVSLKLTIGHAVGVTSPTTEAARLFRMVGKLASAVNAEASNLLRITGRRIQAVNAALAALILVHGKQQFVTSPEAAAIARGLPLHNSATSGQASLLSRGGLNVRQIQAVSAQALNLVRGFAVSKPTLDAQIAVLVKVVGHVSVAIDAAASHMFKIPGLLRGAASPDTAGLARSTGIPRGTIDAAVSFLVTITARFRSLSSVDGQTAATVAQHTRPLTASATSTQQPAMTKTSLLSHLLPLGAASAQIAAIIKAATLGHPLSLGTVSAQALGAVRGISHAAAVVSGAAQASVRAIGRALSAVSAQAPALMAPGLHYVLALAASAQAIFERGSHNLLRGVASPEVTSSTRGGRLVPATIAAFSASTIALRRSVLKLIGIGSTQVAIAGRVNFKIVHTTSGNAAAVFLPKGVMAGASHTMRAAVTTWYHLFVAPWAYQQTTLLPPSGGPAEPPSFGAIDPSDETTFAFDWSSRAYANDPIVAASVVSVPPGMTFFGPTFTSGTLVEVTVLPFSPPMVPATYQLRCTCTFASGRRSSFSIPVPIRNL